MKPTSPKPEAQGLPDGRITDSSIPDPSAPNAVSVTDGAYCAGIVVEQNGKHFAFDPNGYLIGQFESRALAVAALPFADDLGDRLRLVS